MVLKIAYIPHLEGDLEGSRWAENTMMVNLIANTSKDIEITPTYDIWHCLDQDFDLICLHNLSHTALYRRKWIRGGAMLERIIKRPIPAFHTSDYDKIYEMDKRPIIIGGIRGSQGLHKAKRFIKYFDAIHTSNQYLMEKCYEYGARNTYVLYPGVNMDLFKPMPELRPDKFTVGWAGDSTKPMKNADLIDDLGYRFSVANKEHFIPHNEMPEFYNRLDVYVYFSTHEGCNRTILEAMACGLPVVSSNAGAVEHLLEPEWIVEGDPLEKGWLHRFRNNVEVLRNDEVLREFVGRQNRENVGPWAWDNITRRFEHICRSLIYGASI